MSFKRKVRRYLYYKSNGRRGNTYSKRNAAIYLSIIITRAYFDIKEPSGIANDSRSNTLWILTNNYLYNCSYDGVVQKTVKIHIKGQDQLFLDEKNDLIYFSAGADYHGDSYIYTVDLKTNRAKPLYVLKDSYAIEGITIVDDVLYVLNDGYYHDAETSVNQVNIYFLNKIQTKENYQ